jgi:peptidyl-prolyl cis-trans isomerase A (cyclophilin A)
VKLKVECYRSFCQFKETRLKSRFKAESEAKMETLAAGFEKQKADCVTNSFKRDGKQAVAGKTVAVHYEGSLETEEF